MVYGLKTIKPVKNRASAISALEGLNGDLATISDVIDFLDNGKMVVTEKVEDVKFIDWHVGNGVLDVVIL